MKIGISNASPRRHGFRWVLREGGDFLGFYATIRISWGSTRIWRFLRVLITRRSRFLSVLREDGNFLGFEAKVEFVEFYLKAGIS